MGTVNTLPSSKVDLLISTKYNIQSYFLMRLHLYKLSCQSVSHQIYKIVLKQRLVLLNSVNFSNSNLVAYDQYYNSDQVPVSYIF